MAISRRRFMGTAALAGALLKWPKAKATTTLAGLSILQGMTDETSAQFSIVVPLSETFTVAVDPAVNFSASPIKTHGTSAFGVIKLRVEGLTSGQVYKLQICNASGALVDEREFQNLDLSFRKVRLAIVSCAMDHLHRKDIWKQFATQKPELAFFIGDSVYADRKSMSQTVPMADPDLMWERYVATRNKVSFYFQKRLTPVLATWDDHDFGGNGLGEKYPYSAEAKEIFETFFAQDPAPALTAGPGVARKLSAFGGDFYLLDGRTFRGENGTQMFGPAQDSWLDSTLQKRATWLLNGTMFFGAYGDFESFEGDFPVRFQELLDRVKAKGSLAAFISGDVHFSELMDIEAAKLGYATYELVSSSIHSITFPSHHDRFQNPRRRVADSPHNFLIYEGGFSDDVMEGTVTCWGSTYDLFSGTVKASR